MRVGPEWFLIDTGCNQSFARRGTLWFMDRFWKLPQRIGSLDADRLQFFTYEPGLQGLIGNDILGLFDHLWDLEAGEVTISTEDIECEGKVVWLRCHPCSSPYLDARVDGDHAGMLFDTGAKLSYLKRPLREGYPFHGVEWDFHPSHGLFSTPTVLAPINVGGNEHILQFGSLAPLWPGSDESMSIVGSELVGLYPKVGYFPRREQLVLGE